MRSCVRLAFPTAIVVRFRACPSFLDRLLTLVIVCAKWTNSPIRLETWRQFVFQDFSLVVKREPCDNESFLRKRAAFQKIVWTLKHADVGRLLPYFYLATAAFLKSRAAMLVKLLRWGTPIRNAVASFVVLTKARWRFSRGFFGTIPGHEYLAVINDKLITFLQFVFAFVHQEQLVSFRSSISFCSHFFTVCIVTEGPVKVDYKGWK